MLCFQYFHPEAESGHGVKQESIAVVWQGDYTIEDAYGTTVTLYSCKAMGGDCSKCISLRDRRDTKKYGCHWCGNACNHENQCDNSDPLTTQCPKPQILSVSWECFFLFFLFVCLFVSMLFSVSSSLCRYHGASKIHICIMIQFWKSVQVIEQKHKSIKA